MRESKHYTVIILKEFLKLVLTWGILWAILFTIDTVYENYYFLEKHLELLSLLCGIAICIFVLIITNIRNISAFKKYFSVVIYTLLFGIGMWNILDFMDYYSENIYDYSNKAESMLSSSENSEKPKGNEIINKDGDTALIALCKKNMEQHPGVPERISKKELYDIILDHGYTNKNVDFNHRNKYGLSAIMYLYDDLNTLETLIWHGATDALYSTAFWRYASPEKIMKQIELIKDVNQESPAGDGMTPLMYAVDNNAEYSAIETLIKAGADVNHKDKEGRTPLMIYANRYGAETKILDLLIKSGADINATDENGVTTLMRSVADGNNERIQMLVKNGANVHLKDKWGNTLLMYANMGSCFSLGGDYIEINNEHIDKINGRGNMCGEGGIRGVSLDTIKLLLSLGLDINAKNNLGMTPLMFNVIYDGNLDIVKELIKAGADIRAVDNKGYSILLYAKHLNKKIYEYLFSLGLKPEDIQGEEPKIIQGKWMV